LICSTLFQIGQALLQKLSHGLICRFIVEFILESSSTPPLGSRILPGIVFSLPGWNYECPHQVLFAVRGLEKAEPQWYGIVPAPVC
jgi:hypothetical protein